MVDFGSRGGAMDRSDALQIVRGSAIDCSIVYRIDYTDISFLCYYRSVRRKKGMRKHRDRCGDP